MNERFRLNSNVVRTWLEKEGRMNSYLSAALGVSYGTVERMLCEGHVPKPRTLKKLAALLGVQESDLLLPREPEAKRAS